MPNYRRHFVAGGTYFFTLVTQNRVPLFASEAARSILGDAMRTCQRDWPFTINALVLLPDHLHAIWTLPSQDKNYSARWSRIKSLFTRGWLAANDVEQFVSQGKRREGRRGIWQRRFWEHSIQDEDDFATRFDYIHYNPVKHGHVRCPSDWNASTFHRWVKAGIYEANWGCGHRDTPLNFSAIDHLMGEP